MPGLCPSSRGAGEGASGVHLPIAVPIRQQNLQTPRGPRGCHAPTQARAHIAGDFIEWTQLLGDVTEAGTNKYARCWQRIES